MEVINPLYDIAFKYLMDDDRSAKILLSALLRQKVLTLTPRQQETTVQAEKKDITIYRLDYSAHVLTSDGREEDVCIELQKVWLQTELSRFRTYLASQYADEKNVQSDGETPRHIVAIYLLGHKINETEEPVVFCHGGHLTDYDGKPVRAADGKFIRSLTHDIVVVQIPRLPEKPRNATERVLSIFDQRNATANRHMIEVPDTPDKDSDVDILRRRLCKAACNSEMRRQMQLEDEYLKEIQSREERIELQNIALEEKDKEIEEMDKQIEEKDKRIEEQGALIAKQMEEADAVIRKSIRSLAKLGLAPDDIAKALDIEPSTVGRMLNEG